MEPVKYLLREFFISSFVPIAVFDLKKDAVKLLTDNGFKYNAKEAIYYSKDSDRQFTIGSILNNIYELGFLYK